MLLPDQQFGGVSGSSLHCHTVHDVFAQQEALQSSGDLAAVSGCSLSYLVYGSISLWNAQLLPAVSAAQLAVYAHPFEVTAPGAGSLPCVSAITNVFLHP